MKGPTAQANTSASVVHIVKVAIYNVSELENDPELKGEKIDETGSEKWNHTGTYGMKVALESMGVWEYNGKKYKFEADILEYNQIANGALEKGNYKLLLAPGDDDYFDDQKRENGGEAIVTEIRKFVENGGGYLGTCGGAEFACKGVIPESGEPMYSNSNIIPRPLGIIDAYAFTGALKYRSNRAYFYRGIMYDSGTPEEGNGSGVSDWGGIPMKNVIKNPVGPFKNYHINQEINLRYWGGPWFKLKLHGNATGVAKYDKKACENESILLHYKLDGRKIAINLSKYIGDKWSIIIQDSINGEGRIVLFGCHPEHKTWKWGSGQVIENEDYSQYIYAYPKNARSWKEIKEPPVKTYDIIQKAAKWIVEPILNNTSDNRNSFNNTNHSHPIPVPSPQPVSVNTNQQTTNSTNSNNEEADTSKNSLQSSSAEEVAVENEEENK